MADYNILVFEKHAREYDRWFETHAYAYESEVLAVRSLLPRSDKGLEVGVGTGRFAPRVGIKVGVEPAQAMASIARQRGMQVYETGAEALPFADASFDSVLMVTTIYFFSDPLHALRETRRVLKPRGYIVIGMIDKDSPLGKSYEAKKRESTFYRYAHFYSVAQVISRLKQLGFGAIKTRQTILKPPREMTAVEPVKDGYGEGGFVVIAAQKMVKT
ncbi:MAG: class I SAM-dependent methyltransferase [Halobacteriota archaeon]